MSPDTSVANYGLSPPVRGSRFRAAWPTACSRSIPARAGEPLAACRSRQPTRGLSPPVRGSRALLAASMMLKWSIPARAGEPSREARAVLSAEVYPRPCGGANVSLPGPGVFDGLSPPVRGSRTSQGDLKARRRSIPARAGEPTQKASYSVGDEVYPRPCGGAFFEAQPSISCGGLSPPVRGSLLRHRHNRS